MGRIKKSPLPKHDASLSPFLIEYNRRAYGTPLHDLPNVLSQFPSHWPFPRGDLYHWLHLLNRFDDILHSFIVRYRLDQGPQIVSFGRGMLLDSTVAWLKEQNSGDSDTVISTEDAESFLSDVGWDVGTDGENGEADRLIVETILEFSRLLMERCGNRSLYNSSECINDLLNTTSLSLLQVTLRLGSHLAQRYYLRQRVCTGSAFHHSLLLAHYNIDLDRVQRATMPFPRPPAIGIGVGIGKIKSAATPSSSDNNKKKPDAPKINANDVITLFGRCLFCQCRLPHARHLSIVMAQ
ncbi:hypothetical protein KEM54_003714 [Ascosphaera aggregata]|nr:hypothetical protein KEM54_003714 [Ascosphaera aggregata]